MAGIAQVRHDERKVGQLVTRQIAVQTGQRNYTAITARSIQTNRIEVQQRVMFLGIIARITHETRGRHAFQVRFPCPPAGLDLICQVGLIHETIRAVAGNALGAAAHEGNVIRQAGVCDRKIIRKEHILSGKCLQQRHLVAIDDT